MELIHRLELSLLFVLLFYGKPFSRSHIRFPGIFIDLNELEDIITLQKLSEVCHHNYYSYVQSNTETCLKRGHYGRIRRRTLRIFFFFLSPAAIHPNAFLYQMDVEVYRDWRSAVTINQKGCRKYNNKAYILVNEFSFLEISFNQLIPYNSPLYTSNTHIHTHIHTHTHRENVQNTEFTHK